MNIFFYQTSIGKIGIAEKEGFITNFYFETDKKPDKAKIFEADVIKEAYKQLESYLEGKLKAFALPLKPEGTEFMQKSWDALCKIPYGTTVSYKDLAIAVGNVKAVRAVGLANNRNPIPIFIPCHRVIGSNGKLVGYRGGLDLKEKLINLEKSN
jgi:methylated-DNA-[protein]-cysteine S-methyltransferase